MNERFRRELVLAHLRQRREEMAAAAAAVGIQGEQLEETVKRVHGLDISSGGAGGASVSSFS
jgi:hypothetical protein